MNSKTRLCGFAGCKKLSNVVKITETSSKRAVTAGESHHALCFMINVTNRTLIYAFAVDCAKRLRWGQWMPPIETSNSIRVRNVWRATNWSQFAASTIKTSFVFVSLIELKLKRDRALSSNWSQGLFTAYQWLVTVSTARLVLFGLSNK